MVSDTVLQHDIPVFNAQTGDVAVRLRNFVGNGNTMVFTGGSLQSLLFINRYFFYRLETVPLSPGPFRRVDSQPIPPKIMGLNYKEIHQDGTTVSSVSLKSLPTGTTIWYSTPKSSPAFSIKFCQVPNKNPTFPPVKVNPEVRLLVRCG